MADLPPLTWSELAGLLAPWRNYWLSTVTADGAPHAAPVWGVVVDGELLVYTEHDTVKARNLRRDPRVVVHLESGDDVVIVRGRFDPVDDAAGRAAFVDALADKYTDPDDLQYLPSADDAATLVLVLRPEQAMTWLLEGFDHTQRRWRSARGA